MDESGHTGPVVKHIKLESYSRNRHKGKTKRRISGDRQSRLCGMGSELILGDGCCVKLVAAAEQQG